MKVSNNIALLTFLAIFFLVSWIVTHRNLTAQKKHYKKLLVDMLQNDVKPPEATETNGQI